MSKDDFEVLPRGTTEELKVLRQFSKEMIAISRTMENPVFLPMLIGKWEEMTSLVRQLEKFYAHHTEKYPT